VTFGLYSWLVDFVDLGASMLRFGPIEQQPPTGRKEPVRRAYGNPGENAMEVIVLQPIVALIAGILILIMPHLLNYIVAIYLIVIGLVGLLNHLA
jgi:hypothetical protein